MRGARPGIVGALVAGALALALVAGAAAGAPGRALARGEPRDAHTRSDMALARAVELKRVDLPGWRAERHVAGTSDRPQCSYYAPDESDLVETGRAATWDFQRDGAGTVLLASSAVAVFRTTFMAARSWRRTVRPELPECLAELLARAGAAGTTSKVMSIAPLELAPLAVRTQGYRIVVRMRVRTGAKRVTVPLSVHVIALGRRRANAVLFLAGVNTRIPFALEDGLARRVAGRLGRV